MSTVKRSDRVLKVESNQIVQQKLEKNTLRAFRALERIESSTSGCNSKYSVRHS